MLDSSSLPLVSPVSRPSLVDERLLESLERAFREHAGESGSIDVKKLQKALGLRTEYLARRVLVSFDTDGDGVIDKDEFIAGVRKLVFGTDREKLLFAFKLHDHDNVGTLGYQEVLRMIAMSLAEEQVQTRESQPPDNLAYALLQTADTNRDGRISFDEFEAVIRKRPELLRQMTRSEAMWIAPSEDLLARLEAPGHERARRFARFFENRWLPLLYLVAWAIANVVLFTAIMVGPSDGPRPPEWILIGRASARCLDLDGALILLPVMRRVLTWVRSTWLGAAIPVDQGIAFHRIVGHTMFGLAVVHTAAFTMGYAVGHPSSSLGRLFFETGRGLTGTILFAVFAVMWLFALALVRRTSRFELFYFSHLLYFVWFVLAIVHAPGFALWAGVPLFGYLVERVVRLRKRAGETVTVSAHALRSGVTRLDIRRPRNFSFHAGDYVFLRIPAIARHEWHPFTISSAPENDDLSVHVRSLGNWTAALRTLVEENERQAVHSPIAVYVDGPYGTASGEIFESRFPVLIGAGIGVTPFASILESLVRRGNRDRPSAMEHAHFFWLNRDQYSFEWFVALLQEIEQLDHKALLDIHLCMTDGRTGATAVGLEIAREIMHAAGKRDIVTGLRTLTHMGQPDWELVLGAIAKQHEPHRVDVFFCGPVGLANKLRRTCARLGMSFQREQF